MAVVSGGPSCPHEGADTAARVDTAAGWITSTIGAAPDAGFRAYAEEAFAAVLLAVAVLVVVLVRRRAIRPGMPAELR